MNDLTPRVRRAIWQFTGRDPTEDDMVPAGVACQLERELEDANAKLEEMNNQYKRRLDACAEIQEEGDANCEAEDRAGDAALVDRVARLQDECRIAILRAERAEDRVAMLQKVLNRILDNNGSRNQFRAIGLLEAQADAEKLLAGVES